jgi:hypothetical protein
MSGLRVRLIELAIALFFIASSCSFLALHIATPSDGARLEPGEQSWTNDGVIVTPLVDLPNGLHRGDIVLAVDGHSVEFWTRAVLDRNVIRPAWTGSESPDYTILRDGQRIDLKVPLTQYPLDAILSKNWSTFLLVIFTQIVLSLVFVVKPFDSAPRVLFLWAWSFSHTYAWSLGLQVSDIVGGLGFWVFQLSASGAWLIFWGAELDFAMWFTRPSSPAHNKLWVRPAIYLLAVLIMLVYLAVSYYLSATTVGWFGAWIVGNWLVALLMQIPTMYYTVQGYRATRDPAVRRKIRWLAYAFFLSSLVGLGLWFIPGILLGHPFIDARALGLALMPFPVIVAIAILRDQLFDIDVIIRRTLIYSTLTALLAFFYFGAVVVLQQIFRVFVGEASDLAIIISTLAIAALFIPLRRRVQNSIDLRFYRSKYNAQQVLARFGATARDEVELDKLAGELLNVVAETMQPTLVTLWLKSTDDRLLGQKMEK